MDTTIKCFLTSQTSIRFWHLLHLLPRFHAWGYEVGALHYAYSHRCWKKEMEICRSINTQTPQNIRGKELRKLRRKLSVHTPNFNNVGTEKSEKWNKKLSRKPKRNLLTFKIALLIYPDTRTIFTEFPSKNYFQLLESINSMLLTIFEAIS